MNAKKPSFFDKIGDAGDNSEENIEIGEEPAKSKVSVKSEPSETILNDGQLGVDVFQTPNEIIIKSTIAGVKPEDLDISIGNDMVTIKGKREKEEEIKVDDYFYQECYWGSFSRSIVLPVDIEPDKAEAEMKNGVLKIILPKIEKVKTKKLKVKKTD